MTKERAAEIERLINYKWLNNMPYDTIDPVSAFHVGRMTLNQHQIVYLGGFNNE